MEYNKKQLPVLISREFQKTSLESCLYAFARHNDLKLIAVDTRYFLYGKGQAAHVAEIRYKWVKGDSTVPFDMIAEDWIDMALRHYIHHTFHPTLGKLEMPKGEDYTKWKLDNIDV